MTAVPTPPSADDQRNGRDTNEFARVVNLSDAVFAIAMTLLVLTVDVPDVPAAELAAALRSDLPQLGAYVLAFALVASQWYTHRKLFQRLAFTEPGLTLINLAVLGIVALVPFPTAVLGSNPTATAAVAPFLTLFVVLTGGYIAMMMRAQAVAAWTVPLPTAAYRRAVAAYAAGATTVALGIAVAFWIAPLGLVLGVMSSLPVVLILRRLPVAYRDWF